MLRKGKSRGAVQSRPANTSNNRQWHGLPERSLLASAVASCLMLGAPAALGQSGNANLRGQVATATAGTEVVATNVATGVVRRTQTNADGGYVLVGLPPGTYVVESGGSRDTVTLSVASNATLNLEAGTGGEAIEQITVYGQQTSGFDVYTSEVGGTISPREIAQLPQATRNFLEFADTVPGMRFETDAQGTTSLSGGATSSNMGNLYIDGVGQKSYVQAGGIAGQNFTRGNPFPQLAIGQYKVITSNYKAEYGQVAGAAVTAVTRSGTNEFEADAYFRYTDQDLRDERPDEKAPGVEKVDSKTEEYGFAIAGPIIQDRLHYILAYEYKDLITPRSVTPDPNADEAFVQYLPADVRALYGPQDVPFEEDLLFGKLSWNFTDSDLLELSVQYRDEVQVDSIGGQRADGHGRDVINKDERATLRWEHNSSNWFNELLFTTEDSENNPFPQGIGNGLIYSQLERSPTGVFEAERVLIEAGPSSGFDAQARKQDGWSIANNFTVFGLDWYGDHTVKFGVSYKDIELTAQDAGAINPQFRYEVTPAGVEPTPFRVNFLAPFNVPGQRATVVTDSKQYGFYLQDDWAIGDQLIVNLGIRYDYEENPAFTDFVTSQAFVDALYADDPDNPGQPWADRLLPSGLNADEFVSTGNNRDDFDGAWAPRIGFSYDVNADAQFIVHGGAGRFYDRNLFSILSLEVSKAALSPVEIHFQDPGTGECYQGVTGRPCVPWDQAYFDQGIDALVNIPVTAGNAELFMMNNNLETPYTDQFSLGLTTQLGEWQTDVTLQQINGNNGFIFTLINRWPDGTFFQNGEHPWGHPVPGYANTILGNNGIESENTQVLISASKPYTSESGWSVTLAYTHTDAEHNRKLNDNFAFDKATIDQYPFIAANEVPEHRFVASGSIDGPWGMSFGAKLVLETPRPLNEIRHVGVIGPDGSIRQPIAVDPPGTGSFIVGGDIWGYRTVDLQATKEFRVGDFGFTARVNLLNAFDYENYSSFSVVGPDGEYPTVEVNEFGDAYYIPRTINFELGFNF